MPNYSDPKYWEERYASGGNFDWYMQWPAFRHHVVGLISEKSKILIIGNGNSRLPMQLYEDGFGDITVIDTCEMVVAQMTEQLAECEGVNVHTMDCSRLDFASMTFDCVLDKATLDSMLCGYDSFQVVQNTNREICRVLKPGGIFVCVSYGAPSQRLDVFQQPDLTWTIEHATTPKVLQTEGEDEEASVHHLYIMRRQAPEDVEADEFAAEFDKPL